MRTILQAGSVGRSSSVCETSVGMSRLTGNCGLRYAGRDGWTGICKRNGVTEGGGMKTRGRTASGANVLSAASTGTAVTAKSNPALNSVRMLHLLLTTWLPVPRGCYRQRCSSIYGAKVFRINPGRCRACASQTNSRSPDRDSGYPKKHLGRRGIKASAPAAAPASRRWRWRRPRRAAPEVCSACRASPRRAAPAAWRRGRCR